jgi:hypothetical protein
MPIPIPPSPNVFLACYTTCPTNPSLSSKVDTSPPYRVVYPKLADEPSCPPSGILRRKRMVFIQLAFLPSVASPLSLGGPGKMYFPINERKKTTALK